jgi:hypothetical protein
MGGIREKSMSGELHNGFKHRERVLLPDGQQGVILGFEHGTAHVLLDFHCPHCQKVIEKSQPSAATATVESLRKLEA